MARKKGSKNKRTLMREARLRQDAMSTAGAPPLEADSLAIMEEAMRFFYAEAFAERWKSDGSEGNKQIIAANYKEAVAIAKEVAGFRHPRLSAVKIAGNPNEPLIPDNMTIEQLRQDIVSEVARLGHVLDLPVVREPQGIENRPSPGPTNGEGEAE